MDSRVFYDTYWAYEIPVMKYKFTWPSFPSVCFLYSNSEIYKGGEHFWPVTHTRTFTLMSNGSWINTPLYFTNSNQNWGGNTYKVVVRFALPYQPDLYISMVRTWVVGQNENDDVIRTEGETEVSIRKLSGVEVSDTYTFTETWDMSAGVDIKGISAGLNATFSSTTGHSVTLNEIVETTETRFYNIPANEQWRYITIFGVERYKFTDSAGNDWTSDYLDCKYLGNIDNNVRTFLMIVKYNTGSDKPYSTDLVEITD
jgi:hypothetical protein